MAIKLAEPVWEVRWADNGKPVTENPTFYHLVNAESQARYLKRTRGRSVIIQPFSGWQTLAEDWTDETKEE